MSLKSKLAANKAKLSEGNLLGKTAGVVWWLLFGKLDAEQKRRLVGALDFIAKEGKDFLQHVEVKATKEGVTINYKREF